MENLKIAISLTIFVLILPLTLVVFAIKLADFASDNLIDSIEKM